MITLTLKLEKLTQKQEKYLEKEYTKLEKITKKPREYHIKEALIRYIEYMEDIKDVEKIKKEEKKKGKVKYYTSEEANQKLKELRVKNA
ncbi:MAG: hypothetical protein NY202_02290 [Mollicutes bacterium UO1]